MEIQPVALMTEMYLNAMLGINDATPIDVTLNLRVVIVTCFVRQQPA